MSGYPATMIPLCSASCEVVLPFARPFDAACSTMLTLREFEGLLVAFIESGAEEESSAESSGN